MNKIKEVAMRNFFIKFTLVMVVLLFAGSVLAAGGTIKGRVTDDTGEGAPLAQILIQGTTMGDAADQNGD